METIVSGFVKIIGFEEKEINAIEMIASTLEVGRLILSH